MEAVEAPGGWCMPYPPPDTVASILLENARRREWRGKTAGDLRTAKVVCTRLSEDEWSALRTLMLRYSVDAASITRISVFALLELEELREKGAW